MERMIVLIVAGSAACTRPAATAPTPTEPAPAERQRAETNVAWLESRAAELCSCAELTCFDRLSREMNAWYPEHFGEARFDASQSARLRDVLAQAESCEDAVSARIQADISRPAARAMDEMRSLETRMCACADAACAERVNQELKALNTKYADIEVSGTQMNDAMVIAGHIVECESRVSTTKP